MQFFLSYTSEEKLKSLSERLKYLARNKNAYTAHIDQNIKSENLQYNLSLIISHILLKLKFVDRSKPVFESIIDEYNKTQNTTLTFDDFEKINWIRIVNDDVIMPELVRHFIWQVGHYEKENKPIEIPFDKIHIVRCLQIYYQRCFEKRKLTIEQFELEDILKKYAPKKITIDYLKESGVIELKKENNLFYWKRQNDYSRYLRNEIASTLWLLIGGKNATIKEFKKYFKIIWITQIWVENLGGFLTQENTSKISQLAVEYLKSEKDLLKSDDEFRKIWLDADNYQHIDIKTEIPNVKFNYKSSWDFIENVNYHKWHYREFFDYQKTRSFCYSIIRIIVNNEPQNSQPYKNTLEILKDISKPFLVWSLYHEISSDFPFVIPYLLTDSELIPIAFKQVDKIGIDDNFLNEQSNRERKDEERYELINHLWLEVFDLILDEFCSSTSDNEIKGEIISKILFDLTEKVFKYNKNSSSDITSHNAFRKRYDEALKKLSNQRVKRANVYPKPFINPKIIISLLPTIIDDIINHFTNIFPYHTEFLKLKSPLLDLSIEILRLGNIRFSEDEISATEKQKFMESTKELVSTLENYLLEFYSQIDIEVQTYNKGIEKRKAQRGINEFGLEIIDWGYLFLLFEKNNILETFYNNFISTLNFNTNTDKYDKQNKEQFEKIKLYLKSLMIGYIAINQKIYTYEIEGLPVNKTLDHLEKWIKDLSLLYSVDDLSNKRIDIFDEMFSLFGYDIYYQHSTRLLYKCINYFKDKNPNEFVKTFFTSSNDIGRMLTAINILDSKEQKDIISQRISEVNIETFIDDVFTTTELQYALIESVNSENHWDLAKTLIDRIQEHFEKIKHHDENRENLLFQVNLLLAFKEKDYRKLINIDIPKKQYIHSEADKKMQRMKQFYIALFKLYNEKNYDEAIKLFKSLLSDDTKNIRYAFHLYRAETLKAIEIE